MNPSAYEGIVEQIRRLAAAGKLSTLSDGELLARFVESGDESAFTALVERHAGLVLGACRRILGHAQDAEDACQATFLVLARKARAIHKRESTGSWLYGTATRIACKLRADRRRRLLREQTFAEGLCREWAGTCAEEVQRRELQAIVDEELARMPSRYQSALVLCYLEGKTRDEAAQELRWSVNVLRGRLERGRELLRRRLSRRGVTVSAGVLAAVLSESATSTAAPVLVVSTVRTSLLFAKGAAGAGIPTGVLHLAKWMLKGMMAVKVKSACAVLCLGMLGVGAGAWAQSSRMRRADRPNEPAAASESQAVSQATMPAPVASRQPAQNAERAQPTKMEEHTISGVVHAPSGKPAQADVYCLGATRAPHGANATPYDFEQPFKALELLAQAKTDPSGQFHVEARYPSGRYSLIEVVAHMPGAGFGGQMVLLKGMVIEPDNGFAGRTVLDRDVPIGIQLPPESAIEGRLVSLSGVPAEGVTVRLKHVGPPERPRLESMVELLKKVWILAEARDASGKVIALPGWPEEVRTDAQGRFKLGGLGQGVVATLDVSHPDFAREQLQVAAMSADDLKANGLMWVQSSGLTHVLAPGRTLQGKVTDKQTGAPIAGAIIRLGNCLTPGRTDQDGRYQIRNIKASSKQWGFVVWVYPPKGSAYLATESDGNEWSTTKRVLEKNFKLTKGRLIRGRIVDADTGEPVAGASIGYQPAPGNRSGLRYKTGSAVASDAQGNFALGGVPGKGYLLIAAPSQDYLRVPAPQGLEQPFRDEFPHGAVVLDIAVDKDPEPVTVRLRKGVTLEVQALRPDGQPLSKVMGLCPELGVTDTQSLNSLGGFSGGLLRLSGCDPGRRYRFYLLEPELHLGATADIQYDSKRVGPVPVRLQPAGTVRVRVVRGDDTPAVNAQVLVKIQLRDAEGKLTYDTSSDRSNFAFHFSLEGAQAASTGLTRRPNADGVMEFSNLLPGARLVLAAAGAQEYAAVPFTLTPGEVRDLGTVRMEKRR